MQQIDLTPKKRRETSTTRVGGLCIGSEYPIRVQSMANTDTNDVAASVGQALKIIGAGAELLRFTTQGTREVESLRQTAEALRAKGCTTPLVADVHFNANVADEAAKVVEKVRINPGNYVDPARKFIHIEYTEEEYKEELGRLRERVVRLLNICKEHHTALRIGVNHGSLSDRIMSRYGDTPQGMVESCMEFLRICVEEEFGDVVISVKASTTKIMVQTVRLLVERMDKEDMHFPLHLGVTEAGEGEDGRIKSALGIGALLADGIGDTIRVSLSEAPEAEIPVAQEIASRFGNGITPRAYLELDGSMLRYISEEDCSWENFCIHASADLGKPLFDTGAGQLVIENRHFERARLETLAKDILQAAGVIRYKTEYVSCPSCGRTLFDIEKTIQEVKAATAQMKGLKIAVMGCIVNGPGEMADADYGYVGAGRGKVSLYRGKECVRKNIAQEEAVEALVSLINEDADSRERGNLK